MSKHGIPGVMMALLLMLASGMGGAESVLLLPTRTDGSTTETITMVERRAQRALVDAGYTVQRYDALKDLQLATDSPGDWIIPAMETAIKEGHSAVAIIRLREGIANKRDTATLAIWNRRYEAMEFGEGGMRDSGANRSFRVLLGVLYEELTATGRIRAHITRGQLSPVEYGGAAERSSNDPLDLTVLFERRAATILAGAERAGAESHSKWTMGLSQIRRMADLGQTAPALMQLEELFEQTGVRPSHVPPERGTGLIALESFETALADAVRLGAMRMESENMAGLLLAHRQAAERLAAGSVEEAGAIATQAHGEALSLLLRLARQQQQLPSAFAEPTAAAEGS